MPYPERIVARLRARGLDLDRPCGGEFDGGACWLSQCIRPWNKVLHPVSVELIETEPASLTLRSTPTLSVLRRLSQYNDEDKDELYDAAYVFYWLPTVHRCVQSIKLDAEETALFHRPVSTLALALGRSRNVRHLGLRGSPFAPVCGAELTEGLAGLCALESVDFTNLSVNRSLSYDLADLLRRNASHLASVAFGGNDMSQRNTNRLLRALHCCGRLTDLSITRSRLSKGCVKSIARLLRVTTSLRRLELGQCVPLSDDPDLRDIFDALRVNASITELHITFYGKHISRRFFETLVANQTLSRLCLDPANAQSFEAALRCNRGLRHLELVGCHIDDNGAEALARGLESNCTLETLNLTRNYVSVRGLNAFCDSLRRNNTLRSVFFGKVHGSEQERASLSFRMAMVKAYSRIHMDWVESDLAPLSAAMVLDSESPTELHLFHNDGLKEENLVPILENLDTNECIRVLKIGLEAGDTRAADALCTALSSNRSVQRLEIEAYGNSDLGLLGRIARGLVTNNTVSELKMDASMVCSSSIKGIAFLLSSSTSIAKFALKSSPMLNTKRLSCLSRALAKNRTLVDVTLDGALYVNCVSFRIHNAVRRNTGILNMAVSFATKQRMDRRAAEAFEELSEKACLIPQMARITGQTEKEARASVLSSLRYIRSNYLRLTGIVRDTVVCHPGVGTQADALNHECWCAIASYLKVSDVICEGLGTFQRQLQPQKKHLA